MSGFGVMKLTTGTMIRPANMAMDPQLIGDCIITGRDGLANIFTSINTEPKIKDAQQDKAVVPFQYKEYKNGARNAPAKAPQEIPISCAINVTELLYWINAIMAEMAMNTTTKTRIKSTCFFSLMSLIKLSFKKSMVKVELEAITKEERVDMEAERTNMTTRAINIGLNPESIVGIMESNPFAAMSI